MDTLNILSILQRTIGKDCLGVFPSDRLPKQIQQKHCGLVVNTDSSDKPGTHWVAIFFPSDGQVEYFDSYGLEPSVPTIKKFLRKFKNCRYNKKQIQGIFSSVCGHYAVYFILHRWKGIPMEDILHKFSADYEENDILITAWLNENFDLDTETFEMKYIVKQICRAIGKQF